MKEMKIMARRAKIIGIRTMKGENKIEKDGTSLSLIISLFSFASLLSFISIVFVLTILALGSFGRIQYAPTVSTPSRFGIATPSLWYLYPLATGISTPS